MNEEQCGEPLTDEEAGIDGPGLEGVTLHPEHGFILAENYERWHREEMVRCGLQPGIDFDVDPDQARADYDEAFAPTVNAHGVEVQDANIDGVEVPILCLGCEHYEGPEYGDYGKQYSWPGCALGLFFPVKKGSCKRFTPYYDRSVVGVRTEAENGGF